MRLFTRTSHTKQRLKKKKSLKKKKLLLIRAELFKGQGKGQKGKYKPNSVLYFLKKSPF